VYGQLTFQELFNFHLRLQNMESTTPMTAFLLHLWYETENNISTLQRQPCKAEFYENLIKGPWKVLIFISRDPLTSPTMTLDGNVAIITFYSDSTLTSRGFQLAYVVTVNSSQVYNSTHEILSHIPSDEISHPKYLGDNYSPNELSTFIFSPGFQTLKPNETIQSTFIQRDIEGLCFDSVTAYKLELDESSQSPSWNLQET